MDDCPWSYPQRETLTLVSPDGTLLWRQHIFNPLNLELSLSFEGPTPASLSRVDKYTFQISIEDFIANVRMS